MVFAILLAIAATAAALVLAVRVRRQGHALGAAGARIVTLSEDLDTVSNDRAEHVLRADTAEAARDEAEARATALEAEVRTASDRLGDAITAYEHTRDAADELRAQLASRADAATLWALELARVDRRWHVSVAPGIDLTSPIASSPEAELPRVALEIIAAALREETGTRFAIDWQLADALPPAGAILVVRFGDEMLAASALQCEMVELRVTASGDFVELTLAASDNSDTPVSLPDVAFLSGIQWTHEHTGVVRDGMHVRIPIAASLAAGVAA